MDTQEIEQQRGFTFNGKDTDKKKKQDKKKKFNLNRNNFDINSSFSHYMNNLKPSVKKNEFNVSVENDNDQMREIAETNNIINQAERMEKYQPMMGGGLNNLFENGFSELKKEVDGLKKIINNSNMGGYYSVDENEIINNPTLGKYVFVDKQSENFQDLVKNSGNDKLRKLFEKAKKKLSEEKKKEEEKKENSEDSSSDEIGLLKDKNNKNDFNIINNSEPNMDKKKINNIFTRDSD